MLHQKGQYFVCNNERSHIRSGMLTARTAGPTGVPRFSSQPRAFQESASASLDSGYFILHGSVELSIPDPLNVVLLSYNSIRLT